MSLDGDDFGCRPPAPLLCDEKELLYLEIANLGRLAKVTTCIAKRWNEGLRFTPKIVQRCNQIAMHGIYADAGKFRERPVVVDDFTPPSYGEIDGLIVQMCSYANSIVDNPFHVAAYLLWRLNWIHPFYDGNGRISRELAFLALMGNRGAAWNTPLPELIDRESSRYLEGLKEADKAWDGTPHVEKLQSLLCELFIEQSQ
jgi:Fic family protein